MRLRHRRAQAASAGIAIVYQELLLFPELTVAENIFLDHAPRTRLGRARLAADARAGARSCSTSSESSISTSMTKVGALSVANRQRVEIATALSQDARVADHGRADRLARRSRCPAAAWRSCGGCATRGVGIVYVSHKLPEIFALADRVTVLRDGAHVGTTPIGEVDERTLVSHDGRPRRSTSCSRKQSAKIGAPLLELRNVSLSAAWCATSR